MRRSGRPRQPVRRLNRLLGLVVALALAVPLFAASTAPAAADPGHGHGHGHGPTIAITARPTTLDAPVACLARVAVELTNTSTAAGFVTVDFDATGPLEVSRDQLISYFVGHYTLSTSIALTVPTGTPARTYAVTITAGSSTASVPVTVDGGGAHCIAPTDLSATATSWHPNVPPANAVDGDVTTRWGVEYSPYKEGPQSITIDAGSSHAISTLRYWPRQDGNTSGIITGYTVYASTDGESFTTIGSGTWAFDHAMKTATVDTTARYVRLEVTEGGRDGEPQTGGYAVAGEIQLVATTP